MPVETLYPVDLNHGDVRLREFTTHDTSGLLLIYGDLDVTRHLSFEPRDANQVAGIIASAMTDAVATPRTVYLLAVDDREIGQLIGSARLEVGTHRSGQIGFALRPDQWGKGKGKATVTALLTLGFDQLALHRVWGARSPLNTASAKVMTSVGMIEEGRIRHHLHTRGQWRDSIVHSILEHEHQPSA